MDLSWWSLLLVLKKIIAYKRINNHLILSNQIIFLLHHLQVSMSSADSITNCSWELRVVDYTLYASIGDSLKKRLFNFFILFASFKPKGIVDIVKL